jgi:hypothetical protein
VVIARTSIEKSHPWGLKDLEIEIPVKWWVHMEREFGEVDLYHVRIGLEI